MLVKVIGQVINTAQNQTSYKVSLAHTKILSDANELKFFINSNKYSILQNTSTLSTELIKTWASYSLMILSK